jgi:quinol monooxygenase YgiN
VVIVGGLFEVDPDQREEFLARRHELIRRSRAETGCLEYTFAADPIDPGRVVLFERWSSQADLDAHLAVPRPSESVDAPVARSSSIVVYDVSGERPL